MAHLYAHESLPPVEGYDLIGDVHGCAITLERLLQKLGYKKVQGVYQHAKRRVIFLGDIVDRGPHIREALLLVHAMVQKGNAHIVLGNHEYNALTYCTKAKNPITNTIEYLRPHNFANTRLIAETLEQYAHYPEEWKEMLKWFRTIPLFMEFGGAQHNNCFRVVHACWDHQVIAQHKAVFGDGHFDENFLHQSIYTHTPESNVIQLLTRGVVFPLPEGVKVVTQDGHVRSTFRTKFWAEKAQTYGDLLFQPDPIPDEIAALPISKDHRANMVRYGLDEPPLFVGHYWLKGQPKPITNNIACLDYSAVKYGRLVAYRMDGEQQLQPKKFVWEYVDP
ncbi:ser/threonine protein phosphatase [Cellvibrio zantedeschiae]|uniref:Ser/threonine protein phosphatase n=1 Tax=Cellvibrio zantedeschiae TaxID=1237077 RepID=A0ABQ3AV19_9GAMM|nr:metallophosphoesterase [Cellvibrio zantedeschiae]GGY67624.1 ser/threonine protein phosphatase [Cellvibrio zantedeschiae]